MNGNLLDELSIDGNLHVEDVIGLWKSVLQL